MKFDHVKVGDAVALFSRTGLRKAKVDRVMPTRISVNGYTYRRDTGHRYGGEEWDWSTVEPWSEKHDDECSRLADQQRGNRARNLLSQFGWHRIERDKAFGAIEALRAIGIEVDPEKAP